MWAWVGACLVCRAGQLLSSGQSNVSARDGTRVRVRETKSGAAPRKKARYQDELQSNNQEEPTRREDDKLLYVSRCRQEGYGQNRVKRRRSLSDKRNAHWRPSKQSNGPQRGKRRAPYPRVTPRVASPLADQNADSPLPTLRPARAPSDSYDLQLPTRCLPSPDRPAPSQRLTFAPDLEWVPLAPPGAPWMRNRSLKKRAGSRCPAVH